MDSWLVWIGPGFAALVALWPLFWVLGQIISGAITIFGLAAAQGFPGVAGYVAVWVFLLPLMALACFATGLVVNWTVAKEARGIRSTNASRQKHPGEKPWQQDPTIPPDDPRERINWANREPPYNT